MLVACSDRIMLSFEHIEYLIGLLIIIPFTLLFLFVLLWKRKARKALGDEALIGQLTKNYSSNRFNLKFILLLSATALVIIAGANLRKPVAGEKDKKAGIDVMIALDVSKSMWAEDIKPSRLDVARQFVSSLIDRMDNNRVGLVLFAGRAFLQMPLTTDFAVAKLYVANASPDAVPTQGTVIGNALQLCEFSLNTKEKKYKAIILISDGEDHDPNAAEIVKQLADNGVIVHTVGAGTAEGAPIMEPGAGDYKKDINGQTVISKLNEQELDLIAKQTGGSYRRLGNAETTAGQIAETLNGMEKKAIESAGNVRQYASFYPFFLIAAILILIGEIFIPETKRKRK
jgi:Ca-activated chloride channel family protein